jgi:hypothetical protein
MAGLTDPHTGGQHRWVAAATVSLNDAEAKLAQMRGSIRLAERVRIDCLEIYCGSCKRPWDDVFDEPCEALESTEHLRGGPIGIRRKRNHAHHDCEMLGCDTSANAGAG